MSPVLMWVLSLIFFVTVILIQGSLMKRIKSDWNLIVPVISVVVMTGLFIANYIVVPVYILYVLVTAFHVYRYTHGTVNNFKGFKD
ncbi:hypothetical protein [Staphylococcus simulans]|uniref:hypothetical protein n=1 Tax=Staphylococcus simulans TaxID=1286 RepID=UPI0021D47FA9|nr:hypothetical protein [Staphylococcus simulans]UXR33132.1 hypothetical protein MUA81_01890 [Staphylococcus simulans]